MVIGKEISVPVSHIRNTVCLWSAFYLSPFPIKNGDLVQEDVQNLKWGAVSDTLRSRATQSPVVLLHAKEYGMKTNCNFDFISVQQK